MTLENAYSNGTFYYEDPTSTGDEITNSSNYEDELLASIVNDNSEENEIEQENNESKNIVKQKSEYINEEERTDYKKTRKQRKQKTNQHLKEVFR